MIRWLISHLVGFRGMTRDEARDWAAILYTPIVNVCAVALAFALIYGPWPVDTAAQRLTFLGWTLIGSQVLIGMGTFFLQRRTVNLHAKTPGGGEIEIENISAPDVG